MLSPSHLRRQFSRVSPWAAGCITACALLSVSLLFRWLFDGSPWAWLAVSLVTGLLIAWFSDQLHRAQTAERTAGAAATARAERLDAILNTTVDGIIVIDAKGAIEAFNRGAER